MLSNEAEAVLKDVEGILQQLSRYHQLTEEQRLALHTRAGLARQKIGDVVKLMKKLTKPITNTISRNVKALSHTAPAKVSLVLVQPEIPNSDRLACQPVVSDTRLSVFEK